VALSPDETRVLADDWTTRGSGAATDLYFMDPATLDRQLLLQRASQVDLRVFSQDGRRLLVMFKDGYGAVFDVQAARKLADISDTPGHVTAAGFSPDDSRLALGAADGQAWVVDASTGGKVLDLQ
jgi:WD40 repeat protein